MTRMIPWILCLCSVCAEVLSPSEGHSMKRVHENSNAAESAVGRCGERYERGGYSPGRVRRMTWH